MNTAHRFEWAGGERAWRFFRWALFLAGLSLAFYLPYRYATRPPVLPGLYAFLLPLSSLLAIGGMALALAPGLSFRMTVFMRGFVAAVAVLWLAAGLVCIPSLSASIMSAPVTGLLATFQMFAQHVFLSTFVAAFALMPDQTCAWFGMTGLVTAKNPQEAAVESRAHV